MSVHRSGPTRKSPPVPPLTSISRRFLNRSGTMQPPECGHITQRQQEPPKMGSDFPTVEGVVSRRVGRYKGLIGCNQHQPISVPKYIGGTDKEPSSGGTRTKRRKINNKSKRLPVNSYRAEPTSMLKTFNPSQNIPPPGRNDMFHDNLSDFTSDTHLQTHLTEHPANHFENHLEEESTIPNTGDGFMSVQSHPRTAAPKAHNILGQNQFMPISTQRSRLDFLQPWEKTMCKLYKHCDETGTPRKFCDGFLDVLKGEMSGGFDPFSSSITRRDTTMKNVTKKLGIAAPNEIHVTLESGKRVACFGFNLQQQLQRFLLSDVWSDLGNLAIDAQDPWVNKTTENMEGEMMAGQWARETTNYFVSRTKTQGEEDKWVQVPLILYADKTGTDNIEKNTLEPIMATSALLSLSAREDHNNWFYLGMVPNLVSDSSALRQATKGKEKHKSMAVRDYHRCFSALLGELSTFQKTFPVMKHRRGDYVQERRTELPIACIVGDNLFLNVLDGRIGNHGPLSCRLSRKCLTHFENASVVPHRCQIVDYNLIRQLSVGALGCLYGDTPIDNVLAGLNTHATIPLSPNLDKWKMFIDSDVHSAKDKSTYKRLRKLRLKVCDRILHKALGYHSIDNCLHGLDFGARSNGYIEALAPDILHSLQSGAVPRIVQVCIGTMSPGQQAIIDVFVDSMFCRNLNRGLQKHGFPRTNFNKGFCSLTNLSADAKTGQLFTLAILLETQRGREKLSPRFESSFDEKRSTKKKNFSSDPLGESGHYFEDELVVIDGDMHLEDNLSLDSEGETSECPKAPLIEVQTLVVFSKEDICTQLSKLQLGYIIKDLLPRIPSFHRDLVWDTLKETIKPSTVSNTDGYQLPEHLCDYKNDFEDTPSTPHYEPAEPLLEQNTPMLPKLKDTHRINLSIALTMDEFSIMIQGVLCFFAFLKYGCNVLFDPTVTQQQLKGSADTILKLMIEGVKREESSYGWNLQKTIELSHLLNDVYTLGLAGGFSSNTGERGLRHWAKAKAVTAQKRSDEIFLRQVANRIVESQMLNAVSKSTEGTSTGLETNSDEEDEEVHPGQVSITTRGKSYCMKITHQSAITLKLNNKRKYTTANQTYGSSIENWFSTKFSNRVHPGDELILQLYTELKIQNSDGQQELFRCHPSFGQDGGPWFDFCLLQYSDEAQDNNNNSSFPARLGCIYKQLETGEITALVQETNYQSEEDKRRESLLFEHYSLQSVGGANEGKQQSIFREVDVKVISDTAGVIENGSSECMPFEKSCKEDFQILYIKPVSDWPKQFLEVKRYHSEHSW